MLAKIQKSKNPKVQNSVWHLSENLGFLDFLILVFSGLKKGNNEVYNIFNMSIQFIHCINTTHAVSLCDCAS